MRLFMYGYIMLLIVGFCGCARYSKVVAHEGPVDTPYDSLGTLEVKLPASVVSPEGVLWTGVKIATMNFLETPTREDNYRDMLNRKLADKARKHYNADEVINVEYWPDPASKGFPKGYIYARGEMIKYHPFPKDTTTSVAKT